MSFSSEVKKELFALDGQALHCMAAELAALLGGAGRPGRLHENSGPRPAVRADVVFASENEHVVRRYTRLLAQAAQIEAAAAQVQADPGYSMHKPVYAARISGETDIQKLRTLLYQTGAKQAYAETDFTVPSMPFWDENGDFYLTRRVWDRLLERACCKRAFLRGAFLLSGSMSNPRKSYHFEIVCADQERAAQIQKQFGCFDVAARTVARKNHVVVYLKEGSQIVDALNIMGAHASLMHLENVRIIKEMRNDINRRVNCEAANIHKTVNAAYRQQEAIRFLQQNGLLEGLAKQLQEIAALRMEYPQAPIKELGTLCKPPVGKSGVNHRLRRLEEIAEKQGYEKRGDLS